MLQRQPRPILLAAGDCLLDEVHAFQPVVDVGVDGVLGFELLAQGPKGHVVEGGAVDVREGLEETFRVAERQAAGGPRQVALELGVGVSGVDPVGLAVGADDHLVRVFLPPLQRGFGAIDLDCYIVLAAMADLRGGEGTQGPVLVPDDRRAVVVQRTPFDEGV